MSRFNRLTLSLASKLLLKQFDTNAQWEQQFYEWSIDQKIKGGSLEKNALALFKFACDNPDELVFTAVGDVDIQTAIINLVVSNLNYNETDHLIRDFEIGLNKSGYCLHKEEELPASGFAWGQPKAFKVSLKCMYSDTLLDVEEVESEVFALLTELGFDTHKGHLKQATETFLQGKWAASNSQLRTTFEGVFDTIAERLGANPSLKPIDKRAFLGKHSQPQFLSKDLNEWLGDNKNPQFVQGLMNRLHPEGSHLGLSSEDDATFRLHIVMVSLRLFLKRFKYFIQSNDS